MNLPDSFSFVLDVHFPADRSPWPDPGHKQAVPLPGLPEWIIQPHEAVDGWADFSIRSPELKGEVGLTNLLVMLDFLAEAGLADADLNSLAVQVCPEILRPFQVETVGRLFEAYGPVLNALHGEDVLNRGISYQHDFSRLSLTGLPLTGSVTVTFGAALLGLGLLQYGLTVEAPALPQPATSRHQALAHLCNELALTDEIRVELLPHLRQRILLASMTTGELTLTTARRLRG